MRPLTVVYTDAKPVETEPYRVIEIFEDLYGVDLTSSLDEEAKFLKEIEFHSKIPDLEKAISMFKIKVDEEDKLITSSIEESPGLVFPTVCILDQKGNIPVYNTSPISISRYESQGGNSSSNAKISLSNYIESQLGGGTPAYNKGIVDLMLLGAPSNDLSLVTMSGSLRGEYQELSHLIVYDKDPMFEKAITELEQICNINQITINQ